MKRISRNLPWFVFSLLLPIWGCGDEDGEPADGEGTEPADTSDDQEQEADQESEDTGDDSGGEDSEEGSEGASEDETGSQAVGDSTSKEDTDSGGETEAQGTEGDEDTGIPGETDTGSGGETTGDTDSEISSDTEDETEGEPEGSDTSAESCPLPGWCQDSVSVDAAVRLRAVHGCGSADVWAVGAEGIIVHFDGARWESVTSHTTEDLYSVYCVSDQEAWAGGENGTIARFDGSSWSLVDGPSDNTFFGVWGDGEGTVIVVGDGGASHSGAGIFEWNGSAFDRVSFPTDIEAPCSELRDVWGSSAHDIWIAGCMECVLHMTDGGVSCEPAMTGAYTAMYDLTGIDADHVWASGNDDVEAGSGYLFAWDGASWEHVWGSSGGHYSEITGVSAAAVDDVWGVGYGLDDMESAGNLHHFDGQQWSHVGDLGGGRDIYAAPDGHVFVVGYGATIFHKTP